MGFLPPAEGVAGAHLSAPAMDRAPTDSHDDCIPEPDDSSGTMKGHSITGHKYPHPVTELGPSFLATGQAHAL